MPNPIKRKITIAVVGDVHDLWEEADHLALKHLGVDLVLLVGDFGNESLEVVEKVAALDLPKAIILGNHDAWYTASPWGRKKSPYDHSQEDRVQKQLELLNQAHVGYGKLDFPQFDLAVVGGRPFSWGGDQWKMAEFYLERYGVNGFAESAAKITQAALETDSQTVIFLSHTGPMGLGEQPEDICGKDWHPPGGDHGDPDLEAAIAQVQVAGKWIPLVTFGHMHHNLRHTKQRLRTAVCFSPEGTIYFNAAKVPRIQEIKGERQRNFSLVSLENGQVENISLVWLGENFRSVSTTVFYRRG